jgi:hypothetical protein
MHSPSFSVHFRAETDYASLFACVIRLERTLTLSKRTRRLWIAVYNANCNTNRVIVDPKTGIATGPFSFLSGYFHMKGVRHQF